jgi:hypothetical protein
MTDERDEGREFPTPEDLDQVKSMVKNIVRGNGEVVFCDSRTEWISADSSDVWFDLRSNR